LRRKAMRKKKGEAARAVVYEPEEDVSAEERRRLPRVRIEIEQASGRRMVSLRLREDLIEGLKRVARRKALPYQVLIQMWLQERLEVEEVARKPKAEEPVLRLRRLASEIEEAVILIETSGKIRERVRK
jgi:predicted DNA binding CopG/RHH family protein